MSAEMMMVVAAVVVVAAFTLGYALGAAETQSIAEADSSPKEEVSANVRLIQEAERAKKEAAEANLMLEIALARNAELVKENVCLKSRL
ncbi:hypothetical protein [Pseudoflavonifractor sp. An85]|uniref:hypothetical protein n=1 Tax=Pseudoflavonifractor sp. An85 TaxID=1965661 RepID=UPI000B36C605|nr:hypothetical protein [Pseudoflavonifractor sp. An85]OUN19605.1 hypothetical protein B5G37_13565 [Pseudoflavonifractor sp. An85]